MTRGRKPDANQFILQFSGPPDENAWRQALIRRIQHERAGLSRSVWKGTQDMLCFMARCDKGEGVFPFVGSIANAIGRSERTVKRYIVHCCVLGILKRVRRGSTSNWYIIDNAKLFELSGDDRANATAKSEQQPTQIGTADVPKWPRRSDNLAPQTCQNGPAPLEELLLIQSVTHSTTTTAAPNAQHDDGDWRAVEAEVDRCRVGQFEAAVGFVRTNGGSPADVRAIVDYWQQHRDGWPQHAAGNLYRRLHRWKPGQAVADYWEQFSPEYTRLQEQRRHDERVAREMQARRERANAAATTAFEPIDVVAQLDAAGEHAMAAGVRAAQRKAEAKKAGRSAKF